MNKIDRYIASSILWSFLIVILVLLGLDFTLTFIGEMKEVNSNYTVQSLFQVIALRLPGKFTEYIPIASLIGTLIGLGALASTSELTVMRAAGMPIWRIGFSACRPIILISLLGIGVSEFIAPAAEQKATLIKKVTDQKKGEFSLSGGVWLKADENFVYIDAADNKGTLYGIQIFSPNEQKLSHIITAESAQHIENSRWQLNNVMETTFYQDHIDSKSLTQNDWTINIKPEHLFLASQKPEALSLSQLISYQKYLSLQKLDSSQYELQFWMTALRPLASLALVLVALSSVFGPLRSSTMGGRIFSGVLIGIAFQNGLNLFGRMSIAVDFPPILGVSIPILICLAAGFLLIRRRG